MSPELKARLTSFNHELKVITYNRLVLDEDFMRTSIRDLREVIETNDKMFDRVEAVIKLLDETIQEWE